MMDGLGVAPSACGGSRVDHAPTGADGSERLLVPRCAVVAFRYRRALRIQSAFDRRRRSVAGTQGSPSPMPSARFALARLGASVRRASKIDGADAGRRRRVSVGVVVCGLTLGLSGCGTEGNGERGAAVDVSPAAGATPRLASSRGSPAPATPATAEGAARPAIEGPPVPPTPGGSTAPFRSVAAEVGPIVWAAEIDARTKAPLAPVASFPVEAAALHATMPVTRVEAGAVVEATWSYNGTPLNGADTDLVVAAAAEGAWLEFHLSRRDEILWPAGIYAVQVSIDGAPAQAAGVVVGAVPPTA